MSFRGFHFDRPGTVRRFRALLTAVLAGLLCLAVVRTTLYAQEKSAAAKPPQAQPAKKPEPGKPPETGGGVALTGHLSRSLSRPDGQIRFWITIENKSGAAIRNLRVVDFFAPGFERPAQISGGCSGATWGSICASLAAQETVTVWGDLSAHQAAPKENSYAVLEWDSDSRPAQSSVAQLGEIERLSWYEAGWQWLTQLDVGLPTLTALLVGLYKYFQGRKEKRESEKKDAEAKAEATKKAEQEHKDKLEADDRERKERLAAELREQHNQTWNLMLPQANHFSLRYYIPTANAIVTGVYHLKGCRTSAATSAGASEEEILSAFFDLLQLQWHRLRMKSAIGGYYFKSRTAESVAEGLFQKHRVHFEVTSSKRFVTLTKLVKPFTRAYDVGRFQADQGQWDADQKQFYADFKIWVTGTNCEKDLIVLSAMGKVLWYESNRPFLNWYQEQPPVVLTPEEQAEIEDVGQTQKTEDTSMPGRVGDYIVEITAGIRAQTGP